MFKNLINNNNNNNNNNNLYKIKNLNLNRYHHIILMTSKIKLLKLLKLIKLNYCYKYASSF